MNIEGKRNILLKDGDDQNGVSLNERPRPEDVAMQYRYTGIMHMLECDK